MRTRIMQVVGAVALAGVSLLLLALPVLGHDQPAGAEWIMADWMLLSFLAFAGAALVAFIVALKRGYLSNVEEAKYQILTIDEADYYTPDWARETEEETDAER
jgi:hypothetical protein